MNATADESGFGVILFLFWSLSVEQSKNNIRFGLLLLWLVPHPALRHRHIMPEPRYARHIWLTRLYALRWTLILFAMLAAFWLVQRPPLREGRMVFASDGDSFAIRIDGEVRQIRLLGIDAPELVQDCQDASGQPWRCGSHARDALTTLAPRSATISCRSEGKDRFGRELARCTLADGRDLADQLVRGGWALATGEDYLVEQELARAQKRGLWQGNFLTPAEWRAANPHK